MNFMAWLTLTTMIIAALVMIFYLTGKKEKWEMESSSSFECGFNSYFYSRFSFSIQYFMIGLIFLFLDLELCVIMPFLMETMESEKGTWAISMFVMILTIGLLMEWKDQKLEWNK